MVDLAQRKLSVSGTVRCRVDARQAPTPCSLQTRHGTISVMGHPDLCVSLQWGEKQGWLAFITPKSCVYVTERYLVQLEMFQRVNLTVLSSMGAFVSLVASVLKERPPEVPFLITLYGMAVDSPRFIKRSLASLQQIVLHRRDMSL